MVTVQSFTEAVPGVAPHTTDGATPTFPSDLTDWVSSEALLTVVKAAAERARGTPWLELLGGTPPDSPLEDLVVLVAYCYLQGIYRSSEVVQQLDSDEVLESMRSRLGLRSEHVRRFRREHRSAVVDCMTCALSRLWRRRFDRFAGEHFTDSLVHNRHNFGLLEPFYRQARERLDRAIALDSMALDD
jgi:hypothetical protein